jgi:hypothetical protein
MTVTTASVGSGGGTRVEGRKRGVSSWMRCWNRQPTTSSTRLSSIFIATGTIYRPRSGLNLSVATSAHKHGTKTIL